MFGGPSIRRFNLVIAVPFGDDRRRSMHRILLASVLLLLGVPTFALGGRNVLDGYAGDTDNTHPTEHSPFWDLFQGDLTPEMGLGCSNLSGTSGGPNDVAVGVTFTLTPPIRITSHYYNIFTQVSPNMSQLDLVAWAGGAVPGEEIGRHSILPNWGVGDHTVAVAGICIPMQQFYFGHSQTQTNVGMRWGLDTSSGSAGSSFIRAPNCGVGTFTLVDNLGFPGNWVMSVTTDQCSVPVELQSWGSVKARYSLVALPEREGGTRISCRALSEREWSAWIPGRVLPARE